MKDLVLFIWKSCMVETLLTDTLISGQLYLYGHLHETPFFLTPILTLSLHSYKQPGLVTDTFLYPEGAHSWELLLYFIKGKIYFGSSKLFLFLSLIVPFFTAHLLKLLTNENCMTVLHKNIKWKTCSSLLVIIFCIKAHFCPPH